MRLTTTAVIPVGDRNDCFAKDGILHAIKPSGVRRGDQILASAQTPAAV